MLTKAGIPITKTVKDYQIQNQHSERKEQFEWFRALAANVADQHIEQKINESKHKVPKKLGNRKLIKKSGKRQRALKFFL